MTRMRTLFAALVTICAFNSDTTFAQNLNLNHMTVKEYNEFNRNIYSEFQKNPEQTYNKSYTILMTMLGLDKKPESRAMFNVEMVFTVNTLLLVVANANNVYREKAFIKDYRKQVAVTRKLLTKDSDILLLETMTDMFIKQNAKLEPKKWYQ